MPPTYSQLIELVLTDVAKGTREQFSFTWLRQQIRTQARKMKKRLGPRLNNAILRALTDGEHSEYLSLKRGRRAHDISISMLAAGRHEYTHRDVVVIVEARPTTAKTRKELQEENEFLHSQIGKMDARLARANSLIDIENKTHVEVVAGTPESVTDRIKRLIALSKNRGDELFQRHEAEQFQNQLQALNDCYEREVQERREREAMIRACQEWDGEKGELANPERDISHEE